MPDDAIGRGKEMEAETKAIPAWLSGSRSCLDDLFIDPWFTSLWTLQEAFLCPEAFLLPKEAALVSTDSRSVSGHKFYATLGTLCSASVALSRIVESELRRVQAEWQDNKQDPFLCKNLKYLNEVYGMLHVRGILALAARNPILLYNTAQYRRTLEDRDRVYGIQQVFGFRLGTSAPSHLKPNGELSRFALEDQLGAAVLHKYPVLGQLHNFTEPVEEGRGWRISGASRIPKLSINSSTWDLDIETRCSLSTETIKGQKWGFFHGRTCDFAEISRVWKTVHDLPSVSKLLGSRSPQQILLDILSNGLSSGFLRGDREEPIRACVWGDGGEVPRNEQQHRLAMGLTELSITAFEGQCPLVLLLGSFGDSSEGDVQPTPQYHVGLIIVKKKVKACVYWKRLGFCLWQYNLNDITLEDLVPSEEALLGADDRAIGWRETSGLFG